MFLLITLDGAPSNHPMPANSFDVSADVAIAGASTVSRGGAAG
jgi:hypothetical protein